MINMKLIISGDVPSQKNGKEISINRKTGQRFVRSNDRVKSWQKSAISELKEQFSGNMVTGYPIGVSLVFYYKTNRRKDLDNGAGGVMDALVKAGVLEDDSQKFVDCLQLQYGGLDKDNPRVEVYLDEQ